MRSRGAPADSAWITAEFVVRRNPCALASDRASSGTVTVSRARAPQLTRPRPRRGRCCSAQRVICSSAGSRARQRQHGRDPKLLCDMLADDHLTVVHQDVRAGARPSGGDGPAVVDPGERYAVVPHETLEPMWCGQHGASCPALASPLGSATNGCTSPLASSVRIRSFTGRLAHRGSGPSVPSTRAATPSASPWTLRPVRHGACGRRSSRQRPPRTRPH